MASQELAIEKGIEFKCLEAMRYREACHIYYILDNFLSTRQLGSLFLVERHAKRDKDGKKEEIDAIINVGEDNHSIIELKTSVRDEVDANKALCQLLAI